MEEPTRVRRLMDELFDECRDTQQETGPEGRIESAQNYWDLRGNQGHIYIIPSNSGMTAIRDLLHRGSNDK